MMRSRICALYSGEETEREREEVTEQRGQDMGRII